VTDNGSPSLSATQSFTVTIIKTNNPPVFAPSSNYLAQVLIPLKITNVVTDPDIPTNHVTFGIVDAPKGSRINKFTGVLVWAPAKSQARSTNIVSVLATDDGEPPLSATNSFDVIVGDYLELALGRVIVLAGEAASVPVTVTNTSGVTNLSSLLFVPDQLTNISLSSFAPELRVGVLESQGRGISRLSFSTSDGQILQPAQFLASLTFTALPNQPSGFVTLLLSNVTSIQTNGVALTRTLAAAGRVVVIGNEP